MSKNSIGSIVEAAMPGWEVLESTAQYRDSPSRSVEAPEQIGADMDVLRQKYLRPRGGAVTDSTGRSSVASERASEERPSHDVHIARVRNAAVATDSHVGSKAVLVDVTDSKIIGKQG